MTPLEHASFAMQALDDGKKEDVLVILEAAITNAMCDAYSVGHDVGYDDGIRACARKLATNMLKP